jgi:hypothetical protein
MSRQSLWRRRIGVGAYSEDTKGTKMKKYTDSVVGLVICVAYYNLLSSMTHELVPLKNHAGQHFLVDLAQK